ncbi:cobyrinate a,c-diamide synthase [Variovorax terrae]|uniref:Cobyrinate a,c-diamide synthase n=1 Tax=Variovorax terrae TaxID=2923278 RepID=A0A9X2AML8_9BURK|nr:cobyrinate a,c-diamide synthase [Variovorax terrae]MCJ0762935.1 cobyrinate a,c-diamide synthase [Variovorax terrae]
MSSITACCPAVLVAAPASGQGKTTVAAALARLHARQGRRVRVFKCGPDFLDPHWLALASGAPVHQLDLWMTGEADCMARLHAAAQEADLIVIEGVMGLFDGTPSAADLAQRFGLPVLAVIDASAMAGTFGALAYGLQHYRPGLRWAGVLANRVASERHAQMLQEGLREPDQWRGALMRNPALSLPERHLGLVAASEVGDALARLDAAADALAATPLGRMGVAELQDWGVEFPAPAVPTAAPVDAPLVGTTIAVARDAAFCFLYAANLDCLRALGAQLVFFSPLADAALPPCDAVWLPGGYPELHAAALGANHGLCDSLRAHATQGRPIWAECGGMMALFEQLATADGTVHAMWGLLPGRVTMQQRLAALGPQQLDLDGQALRGHTFHYSRCETALRPAARSRRPGAPNAAGEGEALYVQGPVRASYFHAYFPSNPALVARLFSAGGVA